MNKILISTGGSGGHVVPALSLLEHFRDLSNTFLVSDKRGSKFIDNKKYEYDLINVPKFSVNPVKIPLYIIRFLISVFRAIIHLRKKKINILFSTGGYMSLPFCISSKILGVDIFLFEPNTVLGRSNKLFLKY